MYCCVVCASEIVRACLARPGEDPMEVVQVVEDPAEGEEKRLFDLGVIQTFVHDGTTTDQSQTSPSC